MAGLIGDSEKQRQIDRIMCVAFRIARDAGAEFINREWIAGKLSRSVRWVSDNWNKSPQECSAQFGEGRPLQLSQESREIVAQRKWSRFLGKRHLAWKFARSQRGAIIKDEVETKMIEEQGPGRYSVDTLKRNLVEVLESLEDKTELFENLLCSYPDRLKAVRDARGQHTDY